MSSPETPPAGLPSVGVVLPTRDRPALLRRALDAVREQSYPGTIRCVVVYDRTEPDHSLLDDHPTRPVEVITNTRTPGLAGTRNSGILHLGSNTRSTDLVAFCDDDDEWLPGKLAAQVALLDSDPSLEMCCTGIEISQDGALVPRLAGSRRVTHSQLVRSRMSMLHPSTFLFRREALVQGIGLVAEDLPGSYAEDWDLLLRASRRRPVGVVDEPLVRVLWGAQSYFAQRWQAIVDGLDWLVAQHESLRTDGRAAAFVAGKLSFAHAALGNTRQARDHARAALRRNLGEPRAYLALAVSARLVSADRVLRLLNARGRSI